MDTFIGIRVEPLNAWRNLTDAPQALMLPPPMPPYSKTREAFATTAIIDANLVEKGKRAEAVIAAVNKLHTVLTPEQIERVKRAKSVLLTVSTPGRARNADAETTQYALVTSPSVPCLPPLLR